MLKLVHVPRHPTVHRVIGQQSLLSIARVVHSLMPRESGFPLVMEATCHALIRKPSQLQRWCGEYHLPPSHSSPLLNPWVLSTSDQRQICPTVIWRPTFVCPRFLSIAPSDSIPAIHLRDRTTNNCSRYIHASTILSVPPSIVLYFWRKKVASFSALGVINPQQLHLTKKHGWEGKDGIKQSKALISHGALYILHSTCPRRTAKEQKDQILFIKAQWL